MPLATFDFLARVVADPSTVSVGFDALAVQNGCRGPATLVVLLPGQGTESRVDTLPGVVERPLAEDRMDRFPRRKAARKQPPGDASFDNIEDGIHHQTPVGRRTSTFEDGWEHWFDNCPLGIRKVGLV